MENVINKFLNCYGDGDGDSSGYGYGDGSGYGYGSGYGSGYGDGYGVKSFCGTSVYLIDGVQTLIDRIHGDVVKGRILNQDFSCSPCYIVKREGSFAHGTTLKEAMEAVLDKVLKNMPVEKRIAEFIKTHKLKECYPNTDLFDWHNKLTGSCLAGRNAFVKNHGIDMAGSTTVEDFINLTKNDYGKEVILGLEDAYREQED